MPSCGCRVWRRYTPLGRLANAELRTAKQMAHRALDPWWRSYHRWTSHPAFDPTLKHDRLRRKRIYAWLAERLDLPIESCHIGEFDLELCARVIRICRST